MNTCKDCGCSVYNNRCTNCHEELYIIEQHYGLDMELPKENSDFMVKVREQEKDVLEKART